jgi:hypothetical protein
MCVLSPSYACCRVQAFQTATIFGCAAHALGPPNSRVVTLHIATCRVHGGTMYGLLCVEHTEGSHCDDGTLVAHLQRVFGLALLHGQPPMRAQSWCTDSPFES